MRKIVFAFPGYESIASRWARKPGWAQGKLALHRFPDGEYSVRVLSKVKAAEAVLLCPLQHPEEKILPLLFASGTMRELGAKRITLVIPYLPYMRQDRRFHPGEAISSVHFASLLSSITDRIVTLDPHLHRRKGLLEIYSVPCRVAHAAGPVAQWIRNHVKRPLLIGPDSESRQWIQDIAERCGAPYLVFSKKRSGDKRVSITGAVPEELRGHRPVIIDDIISSAGTMIAGARLLKKMQMSAPVCIGVHAVFAGNSYEGLRAAGAIKIVTCNTIPHRSNSIDITGELLKCID